MDSGLLADLVCRDPIKMFVAFDRNYLRAVCINGVVGTFPEEIEAVLFKVSNQVTTLD